MFTVFGADGDEIGPTTLVIPILQPARWNPVFIAKFSFPYKLKILLDLHIQINQLLNAG